jgi:hypothetical protein
MTTLRADSMTTLRRRSASASSVTKDDEITYYTNGDYSPLTHERQQCRQCGYAQVWQKCSRLEAECNCTAGGRDVEVDGWLV